MIVLEPILVFIGDSTFVCQLKKVILEFSSIISVVKFGFVFF